MLEAIGSVSNGKDPMNSRDFLCVSEFLTAQELPCVKLSRTPKWIAAVLGRCGLEPQVPQNQGYPGRGSARLGAF